jgi:hypothetical protein
LKFGFCPSYVNTMKFFTLFLFQFIVISVFSQEAAKKEPVPKDEKADWLEGYYLNPTPEKFVEQMKGWATDGTLQNQIAHPALIGFISQLMRQNREKIVVWAKELSALDQKDLVVFNTALIFSRTTEADNLIQQALGDKYKEFEHPPKILELGLNEPPTMDMLWGFFYATGSENAIRKIIQGFRYEDAPLAPEGVKVPEGYTPYYTELPQLAFSSLYHNLNQHPRVMEICESFYQNDSTLLPMEKRNLYDLLSLYKPEKYPPRKIEKTE